MSYIVNESSSPSYFYRVGTKKPYDISWNDVLGLIKSNEEVRANTLASREARRVGDKEKADKLKRECGAITVSANCVGGHRKKDIQSLTGKLALDFDHIPVDRMEEVVRLAKEDSHTFLCYVTNSGNGLRIIVRYITNSDTATYMDAFDQTARYYESRLHLEADHRTCDETRLSFLSHDPRAVLNYQAEVFQIVGLSWVEKARQEVEQQGYVFAQHHHNEYVWHVAVWLRDHGISLQDAQRMAQGEFAKDYPDAPSVIRSVYTNDSHTDRRAKAATAGASGQRSGKASVTDIKNYLSSAARLRRNAVTREVEIGVGENGWRPISETDVNSLWSHMCEEVCPARLDDMWAIIRSDAVPEYHPFRSYVDALPEWKADRDPDYIGELARRVHTTSDPTFFDTCFRKWFVGILAALFSETVTNQIILVLLGRQGIYKTTFFQRLLPPEWQERYFYTKTNSQIFGKDDKLKMAYNVLINLEEIDRMPASELNQLKAFITEKNIHERPAYGHVQEHFVHIASFCGTGNNLHFLTDTTGNRRWLPFEVLSIDSPYDNPINYSGLYAQAYHLLKNGFNYWFSQEEINRLSVHNVRFEAPNAEAELIEKYFRQPLPGDPGVFLTSTDIVNYLGLYTTVKGLTSVKVGKALSMLGYTKVNGGTRHGYWVVKRPLQEIATEDQRTGAAADVAPF